MMGFTFKHVELEINGQVLEYDDIFTPVAINGAVEEKDALILFRKTKELFDEAGIKFALVFGTLLGAVREHGHIMKGDQDMDICVWDEEKLRNNLVSLQQKGLKVCRAWPGLLYSFRIDDSCYIDVYILRKFKGLKRFPWSLYCLSLSGATTPRKFFSGWTEIEFEGEKCLCPGNPERLLEFWYGSDWRIPQDKKGIYNVRAVEFMIRCKAKIKLYVARILKIPYSG